MGAILSDFESMWRDLLPLGRSADSGGYFRQPWTSPEREARAWFVAEAEARGLEVQRDGLGNLVAWWHGASDASSPGVLTGSHLDSVLDGGAYDGPLGVVSAFAAAVAACAAAISNASRCRTSRRRPRRTPRTCWRWTTRSRGWNKRTPRRRRS